MARLRTIKSADVLRLGAVWRMRLPAQKAISNVRGAAFAPAFLRSISTVLLCWLVAGMVLVAVATVAVAGQSFRLEIGGTSADSTFNSLDSFLGFPSRNTGTGSARWIASNNLGALQFEAQAVLSFARGDDVALAALAAPLTPAAPPTTLFNLSRTFTPGSNATATVAIDRLSVAYAGPNLVVRAGRQAITWGVGLVFHPGDIVAPFSPGAIDTSYKPGVDMIYAQYLFDSGADVQLIGVPRAAVAGGSVLAAASTYALRFTALSGSLDSSFTLARDRGDTVASFSLSGALGGAAWNAEVVHWALAAGGRQSAYVANLSNSGVIFDRNITYFAEYFHNPFGVASSVALDALPTALSTRLGTGQLFTLGRDFLALGAQILLTPDIVVAPSALISLNDGSAVLAVAANYTLNDNTDLSVNLSAPIGASGTEFGGRETSAASGVFATPARQITVRLVRFY